MEIPSNQVVPFEFGSAASANLVPVRLPRAGGVVAAVSRLWDFTLADYNSYYSLDKSLLLVHFHLPAWRFWSLLLLTPWPCCVVSLLTELIPLEDPKGGWRACPNFQIRLFLRTAIFNTSINVALEEEVPQARLPPLQLVLLSTAQALSFQLCLILYAEIFRVFPVPFSFFTVAALYIIFVWASRIGFIRNVLFDKTDPVAAAQLRRRFRAVVRLHSLGPFVMLVYAAYALLFSRVAAEAQLGLAVVLQILRLGSKQILWTHAQIAPGGDDLAGEHVTSAAHFFHALFTSTSLQASKSTLTLGLLVGWNLANDVMLTRKLLHKSLIAHKAWRRIPSERRKRGQQAAIVRAARLLRGKPDLQLEFPVVSSYLRHHEEAQHILQRVPKTPDDELDVVHKEELQWLRDFLHMLHWRETVLLRLYVDVFVPYIYFFFVAGITKLPNAKYFNYLEHADVEALLRRVLIQTGCKVAMVVIMLLLLHRQRRLSSSAATTFVDEPTEIQHLGFILYSHRFTFQAKLLIVGLTVLDFPLAHLGNDLSFRFDWIRHKPRP